VLDQGFEARPSEAGLSHWGGSVGSEQAFAPLVIHARNCAMRYIKPTRDATPWYYTPNDCQLLDFFLNTNITGISINKLKQAVCITGYEHFT